LVNTVTLYRSPVRLVKHAAEEAETYSSQAISRARKKMMAEIALAGDEVVIEDVAYSRNDASTLLDVITEETWKTHRVIYAHKGLLNFLEKEEFTDEELKKADAWLYNERFVKALSPYFAHSFNIVSGRLLREENFEELAKLLNYKGYILPEHSHDAYQKIRNYIDEQLYMLKNLSWERFFEDESILHFIFNDDWTRFINLLPGMFTSLRDEMVEHAISLVLRFQHKATWHYLHQVLVQLKMIETNDFNRSEVDRIDAIIYENSLIEAGKVRKNKSGEVSGRNIWWVLWGVLMIVRVVTCNNRSSRSYDISDQYSTYYSPAVTTEDNIAEQKNETLLLSYLDSLTKEQGIVTKPESLKTGGQPFGELGDDPKAARNDSITIINTSGYDAVYLYFKDLPGHYREGLLPKLYSTYIRNGESETVYLLPGNGRVYFAFGRQWGELKKPLIFNLTNSSKGPLENGSSSLDEIITIDHFFKNTKGIKQNYLKRPLYVDDSPTRHSGIYYTTLTTGTYEERRSEPKMVISNVEGAPAITATGRLYVKQKAGEENSNGVILQEYKEGPPPEVKER
jgi:hypothetical protein